VQQCKSAPIGGAVALALCLTLEREQEIALAPILRESYRTGGSVFAEIFRDWTQHGAVRVSVMLLDAKQAAKVRKALL
jgi:hypothetical protein